MGRDADRRRPRARKLGEIGRCSLVFLVHSETSTGVVADVQALAAVAKEAGALVVVDAVSSLGAVPLETDEWGIDVVVSGSQKALMTPPGLAIAAVSPAALGAGRALDARRASTSTGSARARRRSKLDAAFTPAVSLIVALDVALGLLLDGRARGRLRAPRPARPRLPRGSQGDGARALLAGRGPLGRRHRHRACPRGSTSSELTLALRDRHGVTIAGGQGELKGKIFRIGHIGWYDVFDIATALWPRSSSRSPSSARRSSAASPRPRALEAYAEGTPV